MYFPLKILKVIEEHGYTQGGFKKFDRIVASHSIKFCFLITYFTFAFLHAWQPFYSFLESLISILLNSGKHCILPVKAEGM